jgi:AcrR family transcriptional regulator
MSTNFQAFKRLVNLSKQEVGRVVLHHYSEHRDSQQEGLAVRTLIRIVDSALKLSREKGFQVLRLRDLSEATGLSMTRLHSYVRDKDDLLHLIQSYGHTLNARILLDQIQDVHEPRERLHVAMRTQLWLSEVLQDWFLFWHLERRAMTAAEKQQDMQAELSLEELFCNIIRTGQRQGIFRAVDPELTAAVLKAMLQEWYLMRWKYAERRIEVETYGAFVQALIERHLLPAGGPAANPDHVVMPSLPAREG